jgi:hypothetical protein
MSKGRTFIPQCLDKGQLALFIIACLLLSSCESTKVLKYEDLDIHYDTNIAMVCIDGFKLGMTPRLASIAASNGQFQIVTRFSDVTFDDIVQQTLTGEKGDGRIELHRLGDDSIKSCNIGISFVYGRIESISSSRTFSRAEHQIAVDLITSYLDDYKCLVFVDEKIGTSKDVMDYKYDIKTYKYKPNSNAWISLAIIEKEYAELSYTEVEISAFDSNYVSQQIWEDYSKSMKRIRGY